MRKFEKEGAPTHLARESVGGGGLVLRLASPASGKLPQREQLRALVKFAISQGYYERWNKPSDPNVRSCSSTDFPTDRGWVSR